MRATDQQQARKDSTCQGAARRDPRLPFPPPVSPARRRPSPPTRPLSPPPQTQHTHAQHNTSHHIIVVHVRASRSCACLPALLRGYWVACAHLHVFVCIYRLTLPCCTCRTKTNQCLPDACTRRALSLLLLRRPTVPARPQPTPSPEPSSSTSTPASTSRTLFSLVLAYPFPHTPVTSFVLAAGVFGLHLLLLVYPKRTYSVHTILCGCS